MSSPRENSRRLCASTSARGRVVEIRQRTTRCTSGRRRTVTGSRASWARGSRAIARTVGGAHRGFRS
eukprot:2117133-Alexandrium_andersonii.AAC.1